MNRTTAVVLLAVLLAARPAAAGIDRAGTSAANFLTLGPGPGVLAMGGAALGQTGTLDLASWNPGSLGFIRETSVALSHATLDDQSMQEWASLGGRLGRTQMGWATSALFQNEGSFDGRDASNRPTGSFDVATAAGMVALAQPIGPHASVGLAGTYVLDDLGPAEHGTGFTMDAGLSLRLGVVGLGIVAQNAIGRMTYGSRRYAFPANYGAGVALTHAASGVTAALDVNAPSASYTNVRGGVEWRWKHTVALRAGYRAEIGAPSDDALSGPSFGTGFGARGAWLDYGYLLSGNAGGQHRIALTLRLPGTGPRTDALGQSSTPQSLDDPSLASDPGPVKLATPPEDEKAGGSR